MLNLKKKFAETYELMKKVYGDDCMSRTQVYTWFIRFKSGRDDLNDDPGPGRPEASNRAELVEKEREIIAIDANFTENACRRIKFILLYNLHNIN